MGTSAVSVVMAARNSERTVRAAACSILAQDYGDFELVIVDDASSDATSSILAGLPPDRLRVVRTDTRLGRSAARNLAIRTAKHSLIAIMDADDFALPTRLARSVQLLESDAQLAGIGGQAAAMSGGRLRIFGSAATDREVVKRALLAGRMPLVHPSMLVRREVFDACGGYDEAVMWSEDLELFSRAAKRFEFVSSPDVWLLYRIRGHERWAQLWNTEHARRQIANQLASRRLFSSTDAIATLAWSTRGWFGQRRHGPAELPNPTPELRAALNECLAYDAMDANPAPAATRAT